MSTQNATQNTIQNAVAISEETKKEAIQEIIARLVDREIFCQVSYMVEVVGRLASSSEQDQGELEQVIALNCAPLSEENAQAAAKGEGWNISEEEEEYNFQVTDSADGEVLEVSYADSWVDLCQEQNIDVEPVEIMNHWSVSNFLCEKLAEQGETIDEDFCGLNVWASTDYSLYDSPVIRRIAEYLYNI